MKQLLSLRNVLDKVPTRLTTYIMTLLYLLILRKYTVDILEHFSYVDGYQVARMPDSIFVLILFLLSMLPLLLLPKSVLKVSHLMLWLIYYIVYIPIINIPIYITTISEEKLLTINLVLGGSFLMMILISQWLSTARLITIRRIKGSLIIYLFILLIASLFVMSMVLDLFGIPRNIINPTDVYGQRALFKDQIASIGGMAGRLVVWLSFAFNPVLISLGLYLRNKYKILSRTLIIVAAVAQVYIFMVSGLKSVLFSLLFLVALYILLKVRKIPLALVTMIISVFITGSVLKHFGYSFLFDHIIRRFLVTPGMDAGYYFEYFYDKNKLYYSYSFLRAFSGVVGDAPPFIIGREYYHSAGSANANFWADAYVNMGLYGFIVISLLLTVLLWVTDSVTKYRLRLFGPVFGMMAYAFANSGFFTVLLTYGYLSILILAFLIPDNRALD